MRLGIVSWVSRGDSKRELTVIALWNVPNKQRDVGHDIDGFNDGEDRPERIHHAKRCGEKSGDYRHTLRTSRDRVDLRDGVGARVLLSEVFEPNCHLSMGIRRG